MEQRKRHAHIIVACAFAVAVNVVLGTVIGFLSIPLFFLDTIGTVYIGVNYDLKYGIFTGVASSFLTAIFHGPVTIPFGLVSVVIAIIAHLCSKSGFTYKKAIIAGILMTLVGSLVSTPIRLMIYGGMSNSITDILILSMRASGRAMITASYWGAVVDSIVDKIATCLIVVWLGRIPQLSNYKAKC